MKSYFMCVLWTLVSVLLNDHWIARTVRVVESAESMSLWRLPHQSEHFSDERNEVWKTSHYLACVGECESAHVE